MISCTEFIPLYSEFFKYLESIGGHDEVMKYWIHISDTSIGDKTNPNSLAYKCDRLGGFEGALAYWGHTLTEEACDVFQVIDKEKKYRYGHMRYCPSRGILNKLSHITPYYDYCSHCKVLYQRVLDNYGVIYDRDHTKIDNAECRDLLYEKDNPPDFDFLSVTDEQVKANASPDAIIVDMRSEDNKYLHRDFHLLGDNALKYCAETLGEEKLVDFLQGFTKNYYAPLIKEIQDGGLSVLEKWFAKKYETEEASEVLHTELSDNSLTVTIDKCPAIAFMHTLGKEPSNYYIEETRTVYKTIANECGYSFKLEYYDELGGTKFIFS
ncbi:MAG: hypothetical protein E7613_09690 [Ruminococcaceae bacterium]|nr:hypothetical protein [Oscillospiraceae bacterium]